MHEAGAILFEFQKQFQTAFRERKRLKYIGFLLRLVGKTMGLAHEHRSGLDIAALVVLPMPASLYGQGQLPIKSPTEMMGQFVVDPPRRN